MATPNTPCPPTQAINGSLHQEIPQCKDLNPYVLKDDGWIPQHIVIADRSVYTFITVFMTLQFLLSCFNNSLVIAVAIKYKSLRKPLNHIIVNLAVANLMSTLIGSTLCILANGAGYYFMGKVTCQIHGYCMSVFSLAGLNSITVMAFERYFVICKPFGAISFKKKYSYAGIAVTWIWSLIWNTPPLIMWDGYVAEGVGTSCAPNWFVTEEGPRLFIVLYSVFCCFVPFAILTFCYRKILWHICQMKKESSLAGITNPERRVTKMIVTMVTAYVICWSPYASFAMYNVVNPKAQIDYGLAALPAFFAKSASIYNPLIYMGMNSQFRDCVIRMFLNGKNPWVDDGTCSSGENNRATGGKKNRIDKA